MTDFDQIRDLYEVCCANYDKHMEKTGHYLAQATVLRSFIEYFQEPILELACGTGFLTAILEKTFGKISPNDFSERMTRLAMRNIQNKNFIFTRDNAETLEAYTGKKFATIFDCNLFFYLRNREAAIKRWLELLADGGKIIVMEEFPFIKPKSYELDPYSEKLMELIKPIAPDEIAALFHEQGLSEMKRVKVAIDDKHDLYGQVFGK